MMMRGAGDSDAIVDDECPMVDEEGAMVRVNLFLWLHVKFIDEQKLDARQLEEIYSYANLERIQWPHKKLSPRDVQAHIFKYFFPEQERRENLRTHYIFEKWSRSNSQQDYCEVDLTTLQPNDRPHRLKVTIVVYRKLESINHQDNFSRIGSFRRNSVLLHRKRSQQGNLQKEYDKKDPLTALLEGQMISDIKSKKRDFTFKSMSTSWFVLDRRCLNYYKDKEVAEKTKEEKREVDLQIKKLAGQTLMKICVIVYAVQEVAKFKKIKATKRKWKPGSIVGDEWNEIEDDVIDSTWKRMTDLEKKESLQSGESFAKGLSFSGLQKLSPEMLDSLAKSEDAETAKEEMSNLIFESYNYGKKELLMALQPVVEHLKKTLKENKEGKKQEGEEKSGMGGRTELRQAKEAEETELTILPVQKREKSESEVNQTEINTKRTRGTRRCFPKNSPRKEKTEKKDYDHICRVKCHTCLNTCTCGAECKLVGRPHTDTPGNGGGHYCDRCGDRDSTHRARNCPTFAINFDKHVEAVELVGDKGEWLIRRKDMNGEVIKFICEDIAEAKMWVDACKRLLDGYLGVGVLPMDTNVCWRSEQERCSMQKAAADEEEEQQQQGSDSEKPELMLAERIHHRHCFLGEASTSSASASPKFRKCLENDERMAQGAGKESTGILTKPFSLANPKEVHVRLTVYQIPLIETVRQDFTIDFQLEASWTDFSLKGRFVDSRGASQAETGHFSAGFQTLALESTTQGWDRHSHWTPQLTFQDMNIFERKEEWYKVYDDYPEDFAFAPRVCYHVAGQCSFNERFELHEFPFDVQDLHIRIRCAAHSQEWPCVRLMQNPDEKFQSRVIFASGSEFLLHDFYHLSPFILSTEETTEKGESAQENTYPVLVMRLHVERKFGYWIWNVMLPVFIIVFMSFSSLLVSTRVEADRVMITLTMLLTTVAFKNYVASHLPKVNFVTWVDAYVMLAIVMILLVGVENMWVSHAFELDDGEREHPEDQWVFSVAHTNDPNAFVTFTAGWLVLHMVVIPVTVVLHLNAQHAIDSMWWSAATRAHSYIGTTRRNGLLLVGAFVGGFAGAGVCIVTELFEGSVFLSALAGLSGGTALGAAVSTCVGFVALAFIKRLAFVVFLVGAWFGDLVEAHDKLQFVLDEAHFKAILPARFMWEYFGKYMACLLVFVSFPWQVKWLGLQFDRFELESQIAGTRVEWQWPIASVLLICFYALIQILHMTIVMESFWSWWAARSERFFIWWERDFWRKDVRRDSKAKPRKSHGADERRSFSSRSSEPPVKLAARSIANPVHATPKNWQDII